MVCGARDRTVTSLCLIVTHALPAPVSRPQHLTRMDIIPSQQQYLTDYLLSVSEECAGLGSTTKDFSEIIYKISISI